MSRWILFGHNGLEYGPIEEKKLISWIRERRVSADDPVKIEGAGEWTIAGEAEVFRPYFRQGPGEAGRIKKALLNEREKLEEALKELKTNWQKSDLAGQKTLNQENCPSCSFIEGVERLHEEKKILEEKLAAERSRWRGINLEKENGKGHG